MKHKLPELGYAYSALEPFIDAKTMEVHYTKHHQAYVDKLNIALEGYPNLQEKPIEKLLFNLERIPEKIRTAVRNNGGGHLNHSFFWRLLKKNVKIKENLLEVIERDFGNFEIFRKEFSEKAVGLFGSGWCWLVIDDGKLKIVATSNQDNPISDGMIPILCLDVWEHAYYLKYQNKRADYVENFFKIINWEQVNKNYLDGLVRL